MKVLCLFNNVRTGKPEITKNHFFGMYEMRKHGLETSYLEIEQFLPKKVCELLRKKVLTMHYAHLPLFPMFFKYDVVFTSTAYASLLLKCILGIKNFKWVVLDFNLLGTIGEGKTLRQKVFKWMISKVDGIVTISDAEKQGLEIMFPHLKGKIVFAHEATDLENFVPQQTNQSIQSYILTVGKYGRDFDTIVSAIKDTPYQLKIATKPALTKHLEPLPPNVSSKLYTPHEMKDLYAQANIVIVAVKTKYTTDSVGTLSVGEAMAMKKAVIATDTASMRSYIENGVNGILVKDGDVEEMRKATIELMENHEKREMIAQNGLEFAKRYLSLDTFAQKTADFIKRL